MSDSFTFNGDVAVEADGMTFKRCAHGFDRKRVAAVIVILKGLTVVCDDCLIMTGVCGGGRRCIDDLFDRRVHFAEHFAAHRTAYESFDGLVCVKVIPISIIRTIGVGGRRFVQIDKSDFVQFITKRGNAAAGMITVDGRAVLVEVLETAEIALVLKPLHRRGCEIGQAIASQKTVLTCIIEAAADGDGLQLAASGKRADSVGAAGDMIDVVADRDRGQSIFLINVPPFQTIIVF